MSKEIIDKAKEYLEAQLSVIPINKDKLPAISTWKPYQSQRMKEEDVESLFNGANVKGLAIICGAISENLEVIDVDIKYDVTGELWINFKNLIRLEDSLSDLLSDLLIAKTVNNGYHIFYKCDETEGNQKLAFNVEGKCIIETRGEGGYVVAYPSFGYEFIQGSVEDIPTITPFQRKKLFEIADSLSYSEPTIGEDEVVMGEAITGLSCWDDFNNRATIETVLTLLKAHNWSEVKTDKDGRVYVLRPANDEPSTAKYSGNISRIKKGDREICLFSVFTDNGAPFTENVMRDGKPVKDEKGRLKKQAYTPFKVYALLEHNGDSSKAAKELYKLGYGERITKPDSQVKTELIKVELVNSVNKETSVISNPGELLSIEDIENSTGTDVIITSPGGLEAQEEVLKTIEKLFRAGKRIYIKEGSNELREYRYILNTIFNKYGAIQEETGELTDRDKDSLLEEVVILSTKLQPLDKDQFLKFFTSLEPIKDLGISEESLSITVDRLTSTRDKEAQAKDTKKLLSDANRLLEIGRPDDALELLESKVKEVKLKDKATEFSSLLQPTSEAIIKKEEASLPGFLDTGYTIDIHELLLPGAGISIYAAPTGHGKTVMLINTVLNVAERYPDKKFVLFTYEERETSILQYFLNTYVDINLNSSESSNRRVIRDYFKTGSTQYISSDKLRMFNEKKEHFFKTYIETGRILVKKSDYSITDLDLAIRYLQKQDPTIGGIFIDYIQLINATGGVKKAERINSRQEEMKFICQYLNRTAKDTGLPIVLAAQFNREVANLMDLHAQNIREAADIEQIAHTIVGLWNLSKKQVVKKTSDGDLKEANKRTGEAEEGMYLEILKSRDIPPGAYEVLEFNGNTGRIKNNNSSGISHFK